MRYKTIIWCTTLICINHCVPAHRWLLKGSCSKAAAKKRLLKGGCSQAAAQRGCHGAAAEREVVDAADPVHLGVDVKVIQAPPSLFYIDSH